MTAVTVAIAAINSTVVAGPPRSISPDVLRPLLINLGNALSSQTVNNQTGTSYTILDGDYSKLISFSNAAAIAVTLGQPATGSLFASNWFGYLQNRGSSVVTITPTSSTIDGDASFKLRPRQGVYIANDGTNWYTFRGQVPNELVNPQTGTSYTFAPSDDRGLVTFSNASAIAATLPQAGSSSSFYDGYYFDAQNLGAGALTITPTTSTIDGAASLVLLQGEGVRIVSDGTNYFTVRGLPVNTVSAGATGQTMLTNHGLLIGAGTAAISQMAAMTDGQIPVGQTSADPLPKTMSGDATLAASGALTLASVISAAGPIGGISTIPVITYDAKGRLTAVTTANVLSNRLDQFAAPTASVSWNSQKITSLLDPTSAQDAATKAYVDAAAQGRPTKTTATAATTGALAANTYANGASGVGATLTGNSNGALAAQDGVTLIVGNTLFVKNEVAAANNGLYTVTQVGDGSHPYILTRDTTMDASAEFLGAFFAVDSGGTANANSLWLCTNATAPTVGTTAVTFVQLNKGTDLSAGAGITISGNAVSIGAGAITNSMLAGSIDLTAKVAGLLPLANGGLNANLTASNGGIFYSTGSAGAILAGTATALQMLQSGASSAPAWSTATYPATTTINQLLYSSSANVVAGLATANGGLLNTSSSGVPSITPTPTLGVAGTTVGSLAFANATSGAVILQPVTGALGSSVLSLPAATDTLVGKATTDTLTNKTISGGIATGTWDVQQAVKWSGSISPTALSGDVNDYAPTGFSTATVIRQDGGGSSRNITGLAGGADGLIKVLINIGSNNLVLKNGSASSSAANRFASGADVILTPNQAAILRYDGTLTNWGLMGTYTAAGGAAAGTVTSLTPGAGLTSTLTASAPGGAITSSGTLSAAQLVNRQTGTSYTVVDGDRGKLVTLSNASAIAVTLPQAGASSQFAAGWFADFRNLGAGAVTITPATSTINGSATLVLQQGQAVRIVSDDTNYQLAHGVRTQTTVVGRLGRYTDTVGTLGSTTGLFEDGSGNIGIGTTSPSYPLDIRRTDGTFEVGRLSNTAAGGAYLLLADSTAQVGFGAEGGKATIRTSSTPRLSIDSSGNVGIGTTSPGFNCDVVGTLHCSGALSKGSGTFFIDHPLDVANKNLIHGFVEAPRYDLIYRGKVALVAGKATVAIDPASNMTSGTFAALTQNAEVVALHNKTSFARVQASEVSSDQFMITCEDNTSTDTIHWVVIAERADGYIKGNADAYTDADGHLIPEQMKPE